MLREDNKEPVGLTTIRNTVILLRPKMVRIKTIPQGNQCAHSTWVKASFNFCKQLAILFGKLDPNEPDPPMPPPLNDDEMDVPAVSENISVATVSENVSVAAVSENVSVAAVLENVPAAAF